MHYKPEGILYSKHFLAEDTDCARIVYSFHIQTMAPPNNWRKLLSTASELQHLFAKVHNPMSNYGHEKCCATIANLFLVAFLQRRNVDKCQGNK